MLDINLFRTDKGGNPDIVRESQKRRYADVTLVDQVIDLDNQWRKLRSRVDFLNKYVNKVTKKIQEKMKAKEDQGDESLELPPHLMGQGATSTGAEDDVMAMYLDALLNDNAKADQELNPLKVVQLKKFSKFISEKIAAKIEAKMKEIETARDKKLVLIGNIVHESVVVSDNEDNNGIVTKEESKAAKLLEEEQKELTFKNHVDLMEAIGGMHCDRGSATAGNRGYYLTGDLVRLNLALVNYSIDFLSKRGYKAIYPPYFMNQSIMGEVAQLAQFDEELYKVSGEGEDKYLIATSEQPICAFHRNDWLEEQKLPIRYVGYSACFRKEVGSHGRDTLGIFRVHQFEKIEQFCITNPKETNSWKMMEEMISNSEDFYKSLGLGYRVVNIVSGALNNAAAKKLDLEAWFPGSKAFRELVSCSNCTDYQARRLECRYGTSKQGTEKHYVHMLNATLCATTRVMCCICENYQTKDGIVVPEVLRPYMGGKDFIPFEKKEEPKKQQPKKK